jgi:O-antigen ligase
VHILKAITYFAIALACALPLLIAYQRAPQPAFYNQWFAALLWLIALISLALLSTMDRLRPVERLRRLTAKNALIAFFVVLIFAVLASGASGKTPWFLLLPSLSVLLLCLGFTIVVTRLSPSVIEACVIAIAIGLLIGALGNTFVAAIQLIAPRWYDDVWIAGLQGDRVYGNLRQPNLLALVAVWGALAAALLFSKSRWLAGCFFGWFLLCVFWSGSRAGIVALGIAAIAIGFYRFNLRTQSKTNPSHGTRPKRLAGAIYALAAIAITTIAAFVLLQEGRGDSMSQRVLLWRNTLDLVAQAHWFGVGFNQLNFAWTLTPLAHRSPDVFDHAHNIVLQWAAELGLPTALLLCSLLMFFIVTCIRATHVTWRWPVFGVIAAVLVQSLGEYPLWFAHFLLPTTMLAALLGASATTASSANTASKRSEQFSPRRLHVVAAAATALMGIAFAVVVLRDYNATASIYVAAHDVERTRKAASRASVHFFYGYYGDYATIMLDRNTVSLDRFARPTRAIIDEKLLVSWSRALAREGRTYEADFVAARAREFPAVAVFSDLPKLAPRNVGSAPERRLTHADFR